MCGRWMDGLMRGGDEQMLRVLDGFIPAGQRGLCSPRSDCGAPQHPALLCLQKPLLQAGEGRSRRMHSQPRFPR